MVRTDGCPSNSVMNNLKNAMHDNVMKTENPNPVVWLDVFFGISTVGHMVGISTVGHVFCT